MTDLPTASTTTAVDVRRSTPRKHVEHGDGSYSVEIAGHPSIVYVNGSPADLLAWARQVSVIALELLDRYDQQWVDTTTDPPRVLTFDECARLGLDGTGR